MIENGFHIGERMGLTARDKVWLGSPLFWSFGAANALIATFSHQATLVLQEQFDALGAADQIATAGCTVAYLLPTLVHALRQVPDIQNLLTTVRTGLTIGRPDEVLEVIKGLGVTEICNVYGSTETYGNCCVTPHDMPMELRINCQGPPLPGVQLRIVDPLTDEVLPAGSEGAIEVYGRTTPGYWKDSDGTAKVFTADGWYRTGDIGWIDESGSLVFSTRDTDMIKTGGINVSPAEVEIFISSDPRVAEVVVVGAQDPVRGEVVVAFVRPTPGVALTEEDVIARCSSELASYKAPRVVHIVKEIPRTATGKLSRKQLRESLLQSETGLRTDNFKGSSHIHSLTEPGPVTRSEQ
jgi:fatty-acyl-CoA synthase